MPTICKPLDLYCSCHLTSAGTSAAQGTHHVAQKLIRTIFPLWSLNLTVLPFRSFRDTVGAGFGFSICPNDGKAAARAMIMSKKVRFIRIDTLCPGAGCSLFAALAGHP